MRIFKISHFFLWLCLWIFGSIACLITFLYQTWMIDTNGISSLVKVIVSVLVTLVGTVSVYSITQAGLALRSLKIWSILCLSMVIITAAMIGLVYLAKSSLKKWNLLILILLPVVLLLGFSITKTVLTQSFQQQISESFIVDNQKEYVSTSEIPGYLANEIKETSIFHGTTLKCYYMPSKIADFPAGTKFVGYKDGCFGTKPDRGSIPTSFLWFWDKENTDLVLLKTEDGYYAYLPLNQLIEQ